MEGDFNRDGKLDLAVADVASNTVSVLLNNGNGSFAPAVSYTVGSAPQSIAVADFNGDGKLDLAVSNGGSNTVSILPGNGDGTFGPAVNFAVGNPAGIAAGDFNGDGHPDLAVANFASDTVTVLLDTATTENTPLTINGITAALAPGDGDDALSMSLSVAHGTLALHSSSGLSGTLTGATLSFTGSQSAISTALASGVIYTPANEYEGADTLTVTATDT